MNYELINSKNKNYIELIATLEPLSTENDTLDLISLCWEHETHSIMLHSNTLSDDFFNLKTKLAGHFIQKFMNYNIKAVVVMSNDLINQSERFREMALETNKGNHFRLYESKEDAEKWLLE